MAKKDELEEHLSVEQKRAAILEKQAKLKQELRMLRSSEREASRKLRNRGLIILGGLAQTELGDRLPGFLQKVTRPQDVKVLEALGWLRPRTENTPQA